MLIGNSCSAFTMLSDMRDALPLRSAVRMPELQGPLQDQTKADRVYSQSVYNQKVWTFIETVLTQERDQTYNPDLGRGWAAFGQPNSGHPPSIDCPHSNDWTRRGASR